MIFNKSQKWDFPPEIHFNDGQQLEVISEAKLVGLMVSDNLSWHKNTAFICKRARTKLWILRRMINLNLSDDQIYDVYCKEIRSLLEFAVPVWHPALTKKESVTIERVQKVAFRIILSDRYISYELAYLHLGTTTLERRREKLCIRFANKNLKSKNPFFLPIEKAVNTISKKLKVKEFKCRIKRYKNSSLPYMARMLNR